MLLKGLTAYYLLRRTYKVRKGDPVELLEGTADA